MYSYLTIFWLCIGLAVSSSIPDQQSDNKLSSTNVPQILATDAHVINETNSTDVKTDESSNDHSRKTRGITVGIGEVGLAGGAIGGVVAAPGKNPIEFCR